MTLLCHSLVLVTLFSKPAWSNLPPFDPTQEQASSPPETVTPQSAASTTTRSSPSSASRVNFDFKGFFDHFNKAFGNESLTTLQHYLNERINVDGLTPAANSLSGPVIPCGDAPSVSGASLTYKTPLRTHGSMATYTCDTGFTGNSEVIACHSGKWTDPVNPVICTIVTCPPTPPRIPNSNFHMTSSIYGSQATYTCKSGFQAVGIASPASCLQDGQWSQPNFKCANMMEMMAHNSAYQSLSSSDGNFSMTFPPLFQDTTDGQDFFHHLTLKDETTFVALIVMGVIVPAFFIFIVILLCRRRKREIFIRRTQMLLQNAQEFSMDDIPVPERTNFVKY